MKPDVLLTAGWSTLRDTVAEEFRQSAEEGKDPVVLQTLRAEFDSLPENREALENLHATLLALPVQSHFGFEEPSDLENIHRLRPSPVQLPSINRNNERLHDQLYGAWLGRCCGCALGKPVECFMGEHQGLSSWQRQKRYLTALSSEEWPLKDYFPSRSPQAETETGTVNCKPSTREEIAFMETDDDIRYTVLGQILLQEKGPGFSTRDIANLWLSNLPYSMVCTAETQAYRNLVSMGIFYMPWAQKTEPDLDWNWISTHLNPYREWIGAQIRIDSYGYAAPGNPELAAELAWRDARLSHVKNGIYGAMFCAAMIAAAFTTSDTRQIIEAGLGQIPATSRLYSEMRQTMAICDEVDCDFAQFEKVLEKIHALLGHYHPVHTNNNAALCVAALLLSKGDFHRGITLAVMGGWDSDCNGATVGSIVGVITGAKKAPPHWTSRLNDTLISQIPGYHPIAISECAKRSQEIALKILKSPK